MTCIVRSFPGVTRPRPAPGEACSSGDGLCELAVRQLPAFPSRALPLYNTAIMISTLRYCSSRKSIAIVLWPGLFFLLSAVNGVM